LRAGVVVSARCVHVGAPGSPQTPAVQTSVAAHAVLVPHRQAPDASQVSAFEPHATQALPSAPHWAVERVVTQPVGEQHPDEQFTASQMQAPARQY
jgi:hypothetical protein